MKISPERFLTYFGEPQEDPKYVERKGKQYVVKYKERLPVELLGLKHPNLNRICYYAYIGSSRFHLAVERFGVDLSVWRDRHRDQLRSRDEGIQRLAYSYINQIAHAIQYLHEHYIAHNDVKLANILVLGKRAVLCDFGCACTLPSPSTGVYCGTLTYLSPERLQGVTWLQSDIWALGVTLYSLFVTESPFRNLTTEVELDSDVDACYREYTGRKREIIALIMAEEYQTTHPLLNYKNVQKLVNLWMRRQPRRRKII